MYEQKAGEGRSAPSWGAQQVGHPECVREAGRGEGGAGQVELEVREGFLEEVSWQ